MTVRLQYLTLIYALCCIVNGSILDAQDIQTCVELCASSNRIAKFENDVCECLTGDERDSESLTRTQRHLENVETDRAANGERPARCTLGAKQHLRRGDADRVAKYFLNGGPLTGNSHFVAANTPSKAHSDTTSAASKIMKNPSSHSIFSPLHVPLYGLPTSPVVSSPNPYFPAYYYNPLLGSMNLAHRLPTNPYEDIVGSFVPPHHTFLTGLSNALQKVADMPTQGMVGAQSLLNQLLSQGLSQSPKVAKQNMVPHDLIGSPPSSDPMCSNANASAEQDSPNLADRSMPDKINQIVGSSQQLNPSAYKFIPTSPFAFVGAPYPMYASHPVLGYPNPYSSGYILPMMPHHAPFVPQNPIVTPSYLQNPLYAPKESPEVVPEDPPSFVPKSTYTPKNIPKLSPEEPPPSVQAVSGQKETPESIAEDSPSVRQMAPASKETPESTMEEASGDLEKPVVNPKEPKSIFPQPTSPRPPLELQPSGKVLSPLMDRSKSPATVSKPLDKETDDNTDDIKVGAKQCKKRPASLARV